MAIARMDEEIAPFFELRINQDIPCFVYRLPIDILQLIFIECASDYFHGASGHPVHIEPGWVNVSYVSRHWRDVALNFSTLWTFLFVLSSRWTEELLARSQQASLKIYVVLESRHDHRRGLHFIEQVMDHVERIQELRLELFRNENEVLSKLSSPAPRLRHLKISVEYHPLNWFSELPFNEDTPVLRTLHLSYCPMPWHRFKLSDLTQFTLYQIPSPFRQTIPDFLATLSNMPKLQHLYLHHAVASATGFISSPVFHTFQKVDLPYLSKLFIRAPLSTVVVVLSCVDSPLKTSLRLGPLLGTDEYSSLDPFASLCSCLAERYRMSQDLKPTILPIRSLGIACATYYYEGAKLVFSTLEHETDPSAELLSPSEWNCNVFHTPAPAKRAGRVGSHDSSYVTPCLCRPFKAFP